MKLLLDVGNSRLKWAWWDQGLKSGGVLTHAGHSPAAVLEAVDLTRVPKEVWAASVAAPVLRAALEDWAMRHCNLPVRWVNSQRSACGVQNAYEYPEKLGVDRWLAIIGAYHRAKGAAFVVDAGTALTIDVVDTQGLHLGGLIAPGLDTQRQSLRNQTQVRTQGRVNEPEAVSGWLGTDTDTAVSWGSLHGVIGLIERVHTGIRSEHAQIAEILTGGEAGLLLPHLGAGWVLAPDLVIEGLAHVAQQATGTA